MDKTAIKNFAIWARNKLIADIQYRAGLMGITAEGIKNALPQSTAAMEFYDIGTAEPYSITGDAIRQRSRLVEIIRQKEKSSDYATAYKYILGEVAYTWFNRLIAVRFMEVNDYLPSHIRVLSSESGKVEPDLVTTPFDAGLSFTPAEEETILRLKTENELDELFRLLFIKQCNALNEILPALFEKTNDYTELLLNLSVVDQEGVVYHLINDINEKYFDIEREGQVEIIGWLYQYYNTEPKNAAFAKNGKITKDEIPAVTQLFTPDWIVRYMVENSLGRIFIDKRKNEGVYADGRGLDEMTWEEAEAQRIKAEKEIAEQMGWKYYLPEAEQTKEVREQLEEIQRQSAYRDLRDIKVIDPCMGSGHILVYAFDVLMQMYDDAGYGQRDAAKSILENNLYGLDIDDRAYQLAYFAVMMKARQYNRRILNGENTCHVYSIQESNNINRAHLKYFGAGMSELEANDARTQLEGLLDTFMDAKEYGSILKVENYNWELLRRFVSAADAGEQISMDSAGLDETAEKLAMLISIGEVMAQKYDVVVTNPPYMGSSGMSAKLNDYVKSHFSNSKADMFAVFMEHCHDMAIMNGYQAMITQHAWMFISSYELLREGIYQNDLISLLHLGIKAFEEIGNDVVQTCSFVRKISNHKKYRTKFVRLVDCKDYHQKEGCFLAGKYQTVSCISDYESIPGKPLAYWVGKNFIQNFDHADFIEKYGTLTGSQNITGDNEKYLRCFWEVSSSSINCRWRFYAKGGDYRQYYGNLTFVVYGLSDEVSQEVEVRDVTIRKAELQRDIKSLLSYAVGCMFGRYSLDVDGLAYAGGEWDENKYKSFLPDADGILPITDEEYLEDDIVTRLCNWLKVVYGEGTLEENLDFIAKALGTKGGSSREIIRNYFLKDFFKDHCKTYQKRPIYWLFDSGKQNGFKALIYLHRYTPDTIGNLRVDYLHKMQRVYESEINRMQDMIDHSTNAREVSVSTKRKEKLQKQLKECRDYDEMIAHLALSRIELDLDDGVKVNYEKVQTGSDGKKYPVLAKI